MDWEKNFTKEDFAKLWKNLARFYYRNVTAIWIAIAIVVVIGLGAFLIISFYEPPLREGEIVELFHDDEHVAYLVDRKSVNRTETYTTIVDGKTAIRTRSVFDHYEYCVEKHFDGEDWYIQIQQMSEKREGKIRQRYIQVMHETFKMLDQGDWYVAKLGRDGTDTIRDRNNRIERMTNWTRSKSAATERLAAYKTQEY